MVRVLFVCLGNICRSPSAEGIFRFIVKKHGIEKLFYIDSAGTSAYHVGERADDRMRKNASKRGYDLTSLSRRFTLKDFEDFDYILAMDQNNYRDIIEMDSRGESRDKIKMMNDFSENYLHRDVPDPYYGGVEGFNRVIDILEDSCSGLLKFIRDHEEF